MPIVSSSLDSARPQRSGAVRVIEHHIDHKGRDRPLSYLHTVISDPAAVQAFLDVKAIVDEANRRYSKAQKRFNAAKRVGNQAGMDAATADMAAILIEVQAANADLKAPYDALAAVAVTEVTVVMAARDFTDQLKDAEENDAIEFIRTGGDPGVFTKVDLTSTEFARRLAKRFIKSRVHEDKEFVCRISTWVATKTAVQIANWLGVTEARAQEWINRAIDLRDNVCPALTADDGKVEDI